MFHISRVAARLPAKAISSLVRHALEGRDAYPPPAFPMNFLPARISDILAATLRESGGGDDPFPTLAQLTSALGKRSFGIALVLFGLPNLLPIPGLPILCGVVIGVIAFQMLMGRESLALPGWLGRRRVNRRDLSRVLERSEPTLRRLERVMRPRLAILTGAGAQQVLGGILLLLALALMAPIPFFGGIPPGIAVTLFGLALTERDGVFVIAGSIATLVALFFTVALTYAIIRQIAAFTLRAIGMM